METLIGVLACLAILGIAAFLLGFVLHDSLAECKKTLLALAVFLAAGCTFILHFDPGFGEALQTLIGGAFGVISVFTAPQFSEQDFSKALGAAAGALFAVYKFFGQVDPSTELEILTWVGTGVAVFSIWWTNNAGHRTPLRA